ncbi:hypothetical protein BCR32DRAFT_267065 [Anaeromyces robustus]|uniref:N-acetyltransferase domain-containing protein n=1 Tax=Anaeromyces robustus TaxID=1754192 RepID=A0A1Y1XC32_9FUNG|nr:hypothetical protein BCR32DRAFT_267065 [Anaeromyces robustus]|eukprot:ORX83330.1 hypothetical protein BCR32DRAFT_267065 [Anaeromyces robustus]
MELKEVDNNNKTEYQRIEKLYKEAFPSKERQNFWSLQRRVKKGKAEQWNFYDNDIWVGWSYIIKIKGKNYIYLYYFAINSSLRGKGYGTKALKLLLEKYKDYKIILALEDWREESDDHEQRIKRHEFYLHCGMKDLPYKQQEPVLSFATMGYGDEVKPEEFKDLIDTFMGWPLKYYYNWNLVEL